MPSDDERLNQGLQDRLLRLFGNASPGAREELRHELERAAPLSAEAIPNVSDLDAIVRAREQALMSAGQEVPDWSATYGTPTTATSQTFYGTLAPQPAITMESVMNAYNQAMAGADPQQRVNTAQPPDTRGDRMLEQGRENFTRELQNFTPGTRWYQSPNPASQMTQSPARASVRGQAKTDAQALTPVTSKPRKIILEKAEPED